MGPFVHSGPRKTPPGVSADTRRYWPAIQGEPPYSRESSAADFCSESHFEYFFSENVTVNVEVGNTGNSNENSRSREVLP